MNSGIKIGEVARRSGVGIEALRFYETGGLLDRPARTASGYRVFGEDVLERIAFIKKAQFLGFSLEEIRELIGHKKAGESPCVHVRDTVRKRLKSLKAKIAQLEEYRNELESTLRSWDRKGKADGHVCGLIEHTVIKPELTAKDIALHGLDRKVKTNGTN